MTASEPSTRGLDRTAWRYAARRAWHGFLRHRGIDAAAALTFFSALAIFPAALTIVSAFAIGNGRDNASDVLLEIIGEAVQPSTVESIREPLTELLRIDNPGVAFAIGLVISVWSLSSYATAFGRAVNGAYEVQEGRQIWKFRGIMLVLAVFLLVAFGAVVALLATTPSFANAIGDTLGIGEPWITLWSVGRWPVLFALIMLLISVLYYVTPNIHRDRIRWVSHGTVFAVLAWSFGTAGFAAYVSTVGQYDRIYGWLGGGIVLLLWLYISNLALVLGSEVDAEVSRLRQLAAGIHAEEAQRLTLRDTTRNLMLAKQLADDVADGRRLREQAESPVADPADRA